MTKSLALAYFRQLCQSLGGIFHGQDSPPPSLTRINSRGRFVFRAQWLDPVNHDQGRLIGVTIEHHEPMILHQFRALKDLPLSSTQKEVGLMLVQNHSQEHIGRHLNIKPTTVKDHVRKIYEKLGIHHREELVRHLASINGFSQ